MVCTDRCKYAKGLICKCSCDGENHGIYANEDIQEKEDNKEIGGEIIFQFKDPQKSILEFQEVKESE